MDIDEKKYDPEKVAYYIRAFLAYLDEAEAFCTVKNISTLSSRYWDLRNSDKFKEYEVTSGELDEMRLGKHALWGIPTHLEEPMESCVQFANADYEVHKHLENCLSTEVAEIGRVIYPSWDDGLWAKIRTLLCDGYKDPEAEARRNFYKAMFRDHQDFDVLEPAELECRFIYVDEPF